MTTPTLARDAKVDRLAAGASASREDALTLVASDSKAHSVSSSKRDLDKASQDGDDVERTDEKDPEKQDNAAEPAADAIPQDGVLHGWKMALVFGALMLVVFVSCRMFCTLRLTRQMFALDQSIVATAIPVVASQFEAFAEVPWLITAYFVSPPSLSSSP